MARRRHERTVRIAAHHGAYMPVERRRWEPSQVFGVVVSVLFVAYLIAEALR